MPDYVLLDNANVRYENLMREAEAFRRALGSAKVEKTSPFLKALVIFLISIF
jgi:hypothetical protein